MNCAKPRPSALENKQQKGRKMDIYARNVNDALNRTLWTLKAAGVDENSRNGAVKVFPEPVAIKYNRPLERILWWPERDANPFFHLMESIWMLAGKNDVDFVRLFNGKMGDYSDDGVTFNGAYGHRWRNRFSIDQIPKIIEHLKKDPESRRAVLSMWGPMQDLVVVDTSKDVCCNTGAYFAIRDGKLSMTVLNRSNDIVWGCFGANAVHFSILQEFIATALNVKVGPYYQFSNNLHLYSEREDAGRYLDPPTETPPDLYLLGGDLHYPLCKSHYANWLRDAEEFVAHPQEFDYSYDPFFNEIAVPMAIAYDLRKRGLKEQSHDIIHTMPHCDWKIACLEWMDRRDKK